MSTDLDKLEIQNEDMGREYDRCATCSTEIFVGAKWCKNCMPRVWRDAARRGTWIDGKFWTDKELKGYADWAGQPITSFLPTNVYYEKECKYTLVDTCPNLGPKKYAKMKQEGKTDNLNGADHVTEFNSFWSRPRPNSYTEKETYPDKHEENAMRNLGGKPGYKESFYDRWPTKKSRIGYLFYFLGVLIKELSCGYRKSCAKSD